jgi:murein DD-endopeptidase MepM/ murein hydrolase activator NlpD
MEQEIAVLQAQADEDAVNIYMNPEPQLAALEAEDLTTATRREALLSTIANQHGDVLDRLNGLRVDLVDAQARARDAEAEVEAQRAQVQERLGEYRSIQAEQQRLRAELERRTADVQSEAEDLAEEEAEIQAALERASRAPTNPDGSVDVPPPSSGTLQWPTQGTITGVFGEDRGSHIHAGIDIANGEGTPIVAAEDGTILGGCGGGYGNCVLIDHGGGMVTLYAHQSSIVRGSGTVSRGELIGYMGCTGSCTGPHLHFEVRINGTAVDPMGYL